jgi:hypothetical protein
LCLPAEVVPAVPQSSLLFSSPFAQLAVGSRARSIPQFHPDEKSDFHCFISLFQRWLKAVFPIPLKIWNWKSKIERSLQVFVNYFLVML